MYLKLQKMTVISSVTAAIAIMASCKSEPSADATNEPEKPQPIATASSVPAVSSPAEQREGWEVLFDGKDLSQFRNFKKPGVSDKWVVKDGVFTLLGKGGGDLITKNQYGSFELKLDYKISKEGNSGIMYHVTEEESTPWLTGPEVQIIDNVDGHDPQKSGWLYGLYPAEIDASNPAGKWNSVHIIITPEKCVHYLNGKKYCEYVIGSDDWNKKVAASKFRKFPKFGKASKGYICLQDHGNEVSFRNVMVKDLDKK